MPTKEILLPLNGVPNVSNFIVYCHVCVCVVVLLLMDKKPKRVTLCKILLVDLQ